MPTQVTELKRYWEFELSNRDRTIAGIILGQVLYACMTNPELVLLVVDDVIWKWRRYLDGVADEVRHGRSAEAAEAELADSPNKPTALHQFVDDYTHEVEGRRDLPDDMRANLWLNHAMTLAPAGHPIHTSEAARLGEDPGV